MNYPHALSSDRNLLRSFSSHLFTSQNVKRFTLAFATATLLLSQSASAVDTATTTWNGGTAGNLQNWSTTNNWSGNIPPSSTISAKFNSTFANQPQLTATSTAEGIWLATGDGQDVTITGLTSARILNITGDATLSGQTNAGIILDDSSNHNLTIGNLVTTTLTNSTGFYVNNNGTLSLNGSGTLALGSAHVLTLGGSSTSGTINIAQIISGSTSSLAINTSGTVVLGAVSGATNSFTGGVTLTAGTLDFNKAGALGTIAGTFAINGGTIDNTSGGALTTLNYPMTIGGNFAFTGTNDLNLGTGTVNLGGATRTITANASNLTIGGIISNGGIIKAGNGALTLAGASTYTGGITLNAGTLNINGTGSATTGPLGNGDTFTINGGTIDNTSGAAKTLLNGNPITVGGNFNFSTSAGTALNNLTLPGAVGMAADQTITLNGLGALALTGGLTNTGNSARTLTVSNGSGTGSTSLLTLGSYALTGAGSTAARTDIINGTSNVTISGIISDGVSAGSGLTYSGTGALTLSSGASTYTGGMTLNSGTLNINNTGVAGTSGPLGNGDTFTINGGTIDNSSGAAKSLLNVNPITVGGNFNFSTSAGTALNNLTLPGAVSMAANQTITLNGTGALTLSGGLTNTGNSARTLTVNNGSGTGSTSILTLGSYALTGTGSSAARTDVINGTGSVTISGIVSDGVSSGSGLTYAGSSTLKLSGANTFTGGLNINSGIVQVGSTSGVGAGLVTLGTSSTNGTLDLNGQAEIFNSLAIGSGATASSQIITNSSATAATLTYTGATTSTFGGVIQDGAGATAVTVSGSGSSLTLSGANTYSGLTTVSNATGTLTLAGTNSSAGQTSAFGVLKLNNTTANNGGLASGLITISGTTILDNTSGNALTITNAVSQAASLTFTGSNNLTINGGLTETVSGRSVIANGSILTINNGISYGSFGLIVGSGAGSVVINGAGTGAGSAAYSLRVDTGSNVVLGNSAAAGTGILQLNGGTVSSNTSLTGANKITNAVTLTGSPSVTSFIGGSNNIELGGTFTNSGGGNLLSVSNSGSTTISGNVYLSEATGTGRTLTVKGSSPVTISGNIANFNGGSGTAGLLSYTGSSTLTLSGTNSYTGVTSVSAGGTLVMAPTVDNTATTGGLTVNGTADLNSSKALGSGTLNWIGTLDNTSGAAITSQTDNPAITLTGSLMNFSTSAGTANNNLYLGTGAVSISGNQVVTLNGTGDTVTLGGVATYTGVQSGGTGTGTRVTELTVSNGAGSSGNTMVLGGYNLSSASGTGNIENQIQGTGNLTISGPVVNGAGGGSNGIFYTGSGTLTLAGNNTFTNTDRINSTTVGGVYTGVLVLSGDNTAATGLVVDSNGTVAINSAKALSATGLNFGLSGTPGVFTAIDNTSGAPVTESNNPNVTAYNDFVFGGSNNLDMGSGTINLNAAASGTRTITLNGTNKTLSFDGNVTAVGTNGAGSLVVNGAGNTIVFGSGTGTFTTNTGSNHSFTLGGSGNITMAGVFSNPGTTGTVTYNGTGTLTFQGANTYVGATAINNGVVNYQNGTAFGANSVITAASGATVQVQGNIAGGSSVLTIGGAGYTTGGATGALENVSGTNSYSGAVALSADATISSDAGTLTLSNSLALDTKSGFNVTLAGAGNGVVGGSINPTSSGFGGNLVKNGTGTWTLTADNYYTGTTTINGGALQIGNGGTTGTISFTSGVVDNGTLVVNHSDAVTQGSQIPASISGTGGFTQAGTGTTTLGANSYQGTTAVNAGTLNLTGSLFSTGLVTVANGATLTGTGSAGFTTVAGGGSIALQNGTVGTITLGSLTIGNAATHSALTFDIGSVLGSIDSINDTGALTLLGTSGTTITIGNATGVSSLAAGNYALINYGGTYTGSLANLSLSTTSLDGKTLSLTQGSGAIFLTVTGAGATSTTYSLSTTAAASRILSGQSTTLTTTITNTGSGTADTLNYTGLGATATTVSGATASGGPVAQSGTGTNTAQTFSSTTTGTTTITPTVATATNATAGGNATLSGTSTASVDVVAKRVITNGAATNLGVLHSGAAVGTTTSNAFTTTGTHDTTTDVTVAAGSGTDANGVTLSGSATTFNGTTSSATRTLAGTITNASGGTTTGGFNLGVTGEGLTGEGSYSNVAVNYTAFVYTGQGVWNTNGGGSWGVVSAAPTNWQANGGTPGLDANFTNTDTATFGSISDGTNGATSVVALNGDSPSLKAITFNDSAASYKIAPGTGGSLTLKGNGGNATVSVLAGAHEINAPVSLATSANVNVSSGQQLTISGAISGSGALNNTGGGATLLSNAAGNSYSGGTTVSAGRLYVTNSTGSGTGSGAVSVTGAGSVLGGSGKVSGAVTLSSNGSLYSGGVATGTPTTGAGTGMTLSSALNVNGGNLVFALSNGGSGGTVANPLTTSTYLSLTGGATLNFTGTDAITLVDLSNGGLSLRNNNAYLLASASSNAAYTGLVTRSSAGVLSLNGNGIVLGVSTDGTTANYVAFSFNEFGSDGVTPLNSASTAGNGYYAPSLYLFNGNLEVVPEPGTWALMIGGLALLIVIQRRRNKVG